MGEFREEESGKCGIGVSGVFMALELDGHLMAGCALKRAGVTIRDVMVSKVRSSNEVGCFCRNN